MVIRNMLVRVLLIRYISLGDNILIWLNESRKANVLLLIRRDFLVCES